MVEVVSYECPNCHRTDVVPIAPPWDKDAVICGTCTVAFNPTTGKRSYPPQKDRKPIEQRGIEYYHMPKEEWMAMLNRYSQSIQRRMIAAHIGHIRARVLVHSVRNHIRDMIEKYGTNAELFTANAHKPEVKHLWFHERNLSKRELRPGNPPAGSERPWWLARVDLQIDITQVPLRIWEQLLPGGEFDQIVQDQKTVYGDARDRTAESPYLWAPDRESYLVQ